MTLRAGDWLALSADNATATFSGSNGVGDGSMSAGQIGVQMVFPAPSSPSMNAGNDRIISLIGVP